IYFNSQCPFCLKVKIFLLESGLASAVDTIEFSPGSPEEVSIKEFLASHFDKVTAPAAEMSPGRFIADSDGIIAELAERHGVDLASLSVLETYKNVALGRIVTLFKENAELKRQLA